MQSAVGSVFKVVQYAALGYIAYLAVTYLTLPMWVMIGMLAAMIVAHEFGHWVIARLCGFEVETFSVGFGSSPRIYLGKYWGTEFQITPWLLGGFVSINPMDDGFRQSAAWKRAAVLFAGPLMNLFLALALIFSAFAFVGQPVPHYDGVSVAQLDTRVTIAKDAGLQVGDKIVSIAGQPVNNIQDMRKLFAAAKGAKVDLVVERGGNQVNLSLAPNAQGLIGVMTEQKLASISYEPQSLSESASRAVSVSTDACGKMFWWIGIKLGMVQVPADLPAGATDLHGVVAIVQWGAAALEQGWFSFLMTLAMINLNLFLLNLLPIPVLDGGHLLFISWEKSTGRPVSPPVYAAICNLFALALFALMFVAIYNAIAHPVRFK